MRAILLSIAVLASGCSTVSFDVPRSDSTYIADTAQTKLGRLSTQWVDAHDGASGIYPLAGGTEALAARLSLAEKAQTSIDLQYFLMKGDDAGRIISKSLLIAADRFAGARLWAHVGPALVTAVRGERRLEGDAGEHVSLFAVGAPATGVTTTGLRWPLVDAVLVPGTTLGASNELTGSVAHVRVAEGVILAVQPARRPGPPPL